MEDSLAHGKPMKQIQPHPVLHIDLQRVQEERGDTIHLAEMFKSKV